MGIPVTFANTDSPSKLLSSYRPHDEGNRRNITDRRHRLINAICIKCILERSMEDEKVCKNLALASFFAREQHLTFEKACYLKWACFQTKYLRSIENHVTTPPPEVFTRQHGEGVKTPTLKLTCRLVAISARVCPFACFPRPISPFKQK